MSTTKEAPVIAPPMPGTTTTAEPALPDDERRECHTIDDGNPNFAICGFDFRRWGTGMEPGESGHSNSHSHATCIEKGHRLCQACETMDELGLAGRRD